MTFHHYELLVLFQMIPASILEAMSILIFKNIYIYIVYILIEVNLKETTLDWLFKKRRP